MRALRRTLTAVLLPSLSLALTSCSLSNQWTVVEVTSGSTIVAERGDDRRMFRMPGVIVPQPDAETERDRCLAEEARLHLEALLPVGSRTTINTAPRSELTPAVDVRPLGEQSVFLSIVESGFGHAYVEYLQPNWNDIEDAQDIAIKGRNGLFGSEYPCTYAAEATTLQDQIDQSIADSANASTEAAIAQSLAAIRQAADSADEWIDRLEELPRDAGSAIDRLYASHTSYYTMPLEEKVRDARIRISDLELVLKNLQPPPPAQHPAPSDPGSGGSGGFTDLPGYTGPRCYEPGGESFVPCP